MMEKAEKNEAKKPNCYDCVHRRGLAGDCHSRCANRSASVVGNRHGERNGWFYWPINFDPIWLESCTGFEAKQPPAAAEDGK